VAGESQGRESAFISGYSKDSPVYYHHSRYTRDYRISYFPNQNDGELYDLQSDPHGHRNLYHDARCEAFRSRLVMDLLEALATADPPSMPVEGLW